MKVLSNAKAGAEDWFYFFCQSENLSLVNSSKLGVHLEKLLIQSLITKQIE